MVDMSTLSPIVKLIDFGDATYLSEGSYIHTLLGSPEFSPPEVVNRVFASFRSDMW